MITDLTEAIDLASTFVEYSGGKVPDHIQDGRSLMPSTHGHAAKPREYAISEYDYSTRAHLSLNAKPCLLTMVFHRRWKMIWVEGRRAMLLDLETDPDEVIDLGADEKLGHKNQPAFKCDVRLGTQAARPCCVVGRKDRQRYVS